MSELTVEQKVIKYLTKIGIITNLTEAWEALRNPDYANLLVTGDGLFDEIQDAGLVEECNHESLTNDEIQEVFDNDKTSL